MCRIQRFLVRQWLHVTDSLRLRGYCFRIQRNVWSSVAHAMRQSLSLRISTFLRGNRPRTLRTIHIAASDFPQLQFIMVVDISFVLQRLILMVLVTIEILQLRVDKVADAPFMPVVQIIPVVVQRQIPMVLTVHRDSLFFFDKVIDALLCRSSEFQVPSWRRRPSSVCWPHHAA